MRKNSLFALTLLLMLCASTAVFAAKPKPKAKPAPKPAKVKIQSVMLAGDNGVFGTVYSIRKGYPIYFRLKSAEYTTDQMVIGDRLYAPKAGEKLLVLHFTVQNPQKSEQQVRWDSLRFTAVDSMNVNNDVQSDWGDEINGGSVNMLLKPAQKIDIFASIIVPAKGIIPKLMVMSDCDDDGPILRYDLRNPKNAVAPLKKYVSDPSDASGCTAMETVPGALGTAYPCNNFDITVQKSGYLEEGINGEELEEGIHYFTVTVLVKNKSPEKTYLRWDSIIPVLLSTDGEELNYKDMLLASASRGISRDLKPGEEVTVRLCFELSKDATPQTLSIKEEESRTYEFKMQ
ncbi:MAG: DUF4352 domain-containing protein [Armatimonadota bacterium]